jgi:hypothetical protein
MAETLLFAFHDETLYAFGRAEEYSASVFGGPSRAKMTGRAFGPKPLHHIARLGASHIPALGAHHMFDLPLIYGMYYCGGLGYRVDYGHQIELLYIETATPVDDCPYPDFPPLLPYIPLRLQAEPRPVCRAVSRYAGTTARRHDRCRAAARNNRVVAVGRLRRRRWRDDRVRVRPEKPDCRCAQCHPLRRKHLGRRG